MIRAKNATPPASVSPAKKGYKGAAKGLPATIEHRTPIRANVKTDDSSNQRDPRPAIPSEISHVDDRQVDRLKVFKRSRAMYREEDKYVRPLTTYAACDDIKDWSPSGQTEDP